MLEGIIKEVLGTEVALFADIKLRICPSKKILHNYNTNSSSKSLQKSEILYLPPQHM